MSSLQSWLSKLLAGMLAAVLVGATITIVLDQTVLSSHYLENQLTATNSYNRLSNELVRQVGQQTGITNNPQIATQLSTIVAPAILQQRMNSALDQLQAYYHGNGPQPTIDLTDLATQAQAASIPIPAGSGITKPIVLSGSKQTQGVGKKVDDVRLGTLISASLLTAALLTLSWRQRKWTALPNVLIAVGILVGLLALAFYVVSGLVGHYVKFDTSASAFVLIGRDLATSISSDLARRLGIAAGIFTVVGISMRILVATLRPKLPPVKPMTKAEFEQTIQA